MTIWPELSNRFCRVSFWPIHHLEYSVKLFLHCASMYIIWMIWNTKPWPTKIVAGNLNFWLLLFFPTTINSCFWNLKQKPRFHLDSLFYRLRARYDDDIPVIGTSSRFGLGLNRCVRRRWHVETWSRWLKKLKDGWNTGGTGERRSVFGDWYGYSMIHTRKLTWQWKKQAFEDVSPTKHGDVPLSC